MNTYKINGVIVPEKFLNEYRELFEDGCLPAVRLLSSGSPQKYATAINHYLVDKGFALPARGPKRGELKEGINLEEIFDSFETYNREDVVLQNTGVSIKPQNPKEKIGYVYFIEAPNGKVKIGKTTNLGKRFYVIETMSPVDLELIFAIECGKELTKYESYFHRLFARKRSHGEWFDLSDKDLELVKSWNELRRDDVISIIPIPTGLEKPKNKALIKIAQLAGFVFANIVFFRLIVLLVSLEAFAVR